MKLAFLLDLPAPALPPAATPTPLEIYPALAFDRLFKDEVGKGDKVVLCWGSANRDTVASFIAVTAWLVAIV